MDERNITLNSNWFFIVTKLKKRCMFRGLKALHKRERASGIEVEERPIRQKQASWAKYTEVDKCLFSLNYIRSSQENSFDLKIHNE